MIINYLTEIVPIILCSLPLLLVWRFLAIWIMKKRGLKSTSAHELGTVLLGGFCIYILVETVWSQSPCLPSLADINFVPFRVFIYTAEGVANGNYTPLLINFIGNMVVFMPIGFLFGLCYRASNIRRAALMGLSPVADRGDRSAFQREKHRRGRPVAKYLRRSRGLRLMPYSSARYAGLYREI